MTPVKPLAPILKARARAAAASKYPIEAYYFELQRMQSALENIPLDGLTREIQHILVETALQLSYLRAELPTLAGTTSAVGNP